MSLSYEKAKKLGGSDFLLYRELALHFGISIALAAILIAIKAFVYWKWVFIVAIIASLATFLIEIDEN